MVKAKVGRANMSRKSRIGDRARLLRTSNDPSEDLQARETLLPPRPLARRPPQLDHRPAQTLPRLLQTAVRHPVATVLRFRVAPYPTTTLKFSHSLSPADPSSPDSTRLSSFTTRKLSRPSKNPSNEVNPTLELSYSKMRTQIVTSSLI